MLTSKAPTETLQLPHEPGQWIEIRKLSRAQLRHAQAVAASENFRTLREMGGEVAGLIRSVQDGGENAAEAAEIRARQAVDPLRGYDVDTLLVDGIVRWSYAEGKPTSEDIADLDGETAEYVARHLVPLPRSEDDRKNDSAPSTPTWTDEPTR